MNCSICYDKIVGWSYSAEPIEDGMACIGCFTKRVMPHRAKFAKEAAEQHRKNKKKNEER